MPRAVGDFLPQEHAFHHSLRARRAGRWRCISTKGTLMKSHLLLGLLSAVTLAAAPAFAQAPHPAGQPQPVLTDTAPMPPEERSSAGAILIETSPVPAQRAAFQRIAARNDAMATQLAQTVKDQAEADRALAAREGEPDTTQMGAPPELKAKKKKPLR